MDLSQRRRKPARSAAQFAYWLLAASITAFVAVTSGSRGELRLIDGWEHHRAVRVMAELGFRAGNPTYATPEPSIRYSPYTALLALVTRASHWEAWDVMTAAAVVNTALLFVAIFLLLAAYGRTSASVPTALVMLLLYGAPPGYANTLALEDLPVHQVNPSAFALALCLFSWAGWAWAGRGPGRTRWMGPAVSMALVIAILSHGMTGILGMIGLGSVAIASEERPRMLVNTAVVCAATLAVCALWPYYSFVHAVLDNPNPEHWFNPGILTAMLAIWCLPAMVAGTLAIPYRDDAFVRFGLFGAGVTLLLSLAAIPIKSATFARLPLAGLIFSQLLTGYVLARWELGRRSTWSAIGAGLRSSDPAAFAGSFVRLALPLTIVYFAVPQVVDVAREPHLMRPFLARLLHRADKRTHLPDDYRRVLAPVAERDVVMAHRFTAWPVPSFHGRIVAAAHFEFFTPGQRQRFDDAETFMHVGTPASERIRLLDTYGARWILLDRTLNERVLPELLVPPAVVSQSGDLILMDAALWRAQAAPATIAR